MKCLPIILLMLILGSCKLSDDNSDEKTSDETTTEEAASYDYTLVFASCNDQDREQPLWQPILQQAPDLFVWGGDNIYADTADMAKMKADYDKLASHPVYRSLAEKTVITGTWDDHDFGKNDAGKEWPKKEEAKALFLDFLKVPANDIRRKQAGVYTSQTYSTEAGSIKLILLDTRTFRDSLKQSSTPDRRYDEWKPGEGGTVLGTEQWKWLEEELKDDSANFTLIVSSIQLLNDQHGWEKWGNHPSEAEKMKQLLSAAKAHNIIILSGDRHLAEISIDSLPGKSYPLIDFTSSGLTHTYIDGATEGNPYRISNVIKKLNFGVLRFDFQNSTVAFEIMGEDGFLFERHIQQY